jgi:hypothetical protein
MRAVLSSHPLLSFALSFQIIFNQVDGKKKKLKLSHKSNIILRHYITYKKNVHTCEKIKQE